jgi:hypothetical protein
MESITVRLGSRIYGRTCDQTRMQTQSAASSGATMPLLAINRKDTGANRLAGTAPEWGGFNIRCRTNRKLAIKRVSNPKTPPKTEICYGVLDANTRKTACRDGM